jgi:hypothetical protein
MLYTSFGLTELFVAIRHRINKPKPLLYHKLYGGLENPPVRVWPGMAREPWQPEHQAGLVMGVSRHRYFPTKLNIDPKDVIAGLIRNHDPMRGGIGPGQGFSSWVCTIILVRGNGPKGALDKRYFRVDPKTGKRTMLETRDLLNIWKFSSRAEPRKAFYIPGQQRGFRTQQELNLEEEALHGIYLDYEELHGIKFPWSQMRYRKQRSAE